MGHVVDIFKVIPQLISQRIDNVFNDRQYQLTFKQYVDRKNVEEKRSQYPLDAYKIVQKIKTDLYQLYNDEWMEILLWLKETASEAYKDDFEFEVPQVSAHIAQYGLVYVDRINDRGHHFSFTLGDFLIDYYNVFDENFNHEKEFTCYLTAEEFKTFIAYGLHLFAAMLLKENYLVHTSNEYLTNTINEVRIDRKLKAVIEENVNDIIENKKVDNNADDNSLYNSKYGRYYCEIEGFDNLFYQFQALWKQYKDNQMSVILV